MDVPYLRFKQEDGDEYPEWEEKQLGSILQVCHGKDYQKYSSGIYPVIGTGGVMAFIDHFNCDWPCALIGRKGTIDKPQYFDKPFWAIDTIFYTKPHINEAPKWQYYLFNTIDWKSRQTGTGRPSLRSKDIEQIQVYVPCLEEQHKIADFLSAVDAQIENYQQLLNNLETQKKELLRQIFSQELRFKKEDGSNYPDWEEKLIGDILHLCHGKDYQQYSVGQYPVIGTGGIITYIDHYNCDWPCALIGRKGSIDKPQYWDTPFWAIDTIFYSKPRTGENPKWQYYLFHTINWHLITTGHRPSLTMSDVESVNIHVPCLEEQQKIADFFSDFDKRIELERQRLQTMQELKKGLLQQMFC